MKVTHENVETLPISDSEKVLLYSLLDDLVKEINRHGKAKLYLNFIDEHTKYSPERVDPCPDYYGMYQLIVEDDPRVTIGVEMTLKELDLAMCVLCNYIMEI